MAPGRESPVSWLSSLFSRRAGRWTGDDALLRLRTTRFRQLLASQGALLSLIEDSADKQGGGFVFDRQYVIALAEQAAELADAVAFDLNVLTSQRNLAFYDQAERLRAELRVMIAGGLEPGDGRRGEGVDSSESAPPDRADRGLGGAAGTGVSPVDLAEALSRCEVLYRAAGTVACRGVAAGPVCNLGDRPELASVAPGSVLVAADLGPAEGVLATVRRAGALLLDRGTSAGPAARLARELRVPAILGLGDVTARLATGVEVTVDADEGVVYRGRVPELLEYAASTRSSAQEEEPEYRLLRALRRAAFPLTLPAGPPEPTLTDCRTIHDLVHLAHLLAGDALFDLLLGEKGRTAIQVRLPGVRWCELRLVALDGIARHAGAAIGPLDLTSRPLRALLEGLAGARGLEREVGDDVLRAAATDEHSLAVMASAQGIDAIDATVAGVSEANRIYCRFAPRGQGDPDGYRGQLAAGALSRLGFAVSVTARGATGWMRGLPAGETEERLRILGGLWARLARPGSIGWRRAEVEDGAETLLHGYT
jgi:phosphohistidine swiveling domain-containing protein